ncbi:MAG: Purine nucleoside phosphorylase [Ilumatobacteraceae bacterium]|nr:Purine nucleoside phosphorylase [Ilumatobacteraceae bacterium]
MPIHLRAEPSDYAPAVLVPGDPRRAKYIAETFFDTGARCVNEERGMLGFTGSYKGKPLSVQSVGMGGASAAIYYTELAQQLGATRLIRVGTAGGLATGLRMGDTVVAVSATSDDPMIGILTDGDPHAPTADWRLVDLAARLARERGATVHVGPIVTSAVFYDTRPGIMKRWKDRGHLAIEMEAAILYTLGAILGFQAMALMTISDLIGDEGDSERISDAELKQGVDKMMEVACDVAVADL